MKGVGRKGKGAADSCRAMPPCINFQRVAPVVS
jgi:hypothetical protein